MATIPGRLTQVVAAILWVLALAAPPAACAQVCGTPVAEAGFVRIGGIDQWVSIRGDDRCKPVILFVHGGPGEAQSPVPSLYAPYEKAFVVAHWDQRGAGKTFERNGTSTPDLTLGRIAADGLEVAEHARRRTGQAKVILLGHSWGSLVAAHMVRQQAEPFSGLVSLGQFTSWRTIVEDQRDKTLRRARRENDQAAIGALTALGTIDPDDRAQTAVIRQQANAYMVPSDAAFLADYRRATLSTPERAAIVQASSEFSISRLLPTLLSVRIDEAGMDKPVPFLIVHGVDDLITPTPGILAYFEEVRAPAKTMVLVAGGHFAYASNPAAVIAALNAYIPAGEVRTPAAP